MQDVLGRGTNPSLRRQLAEIVKDLKYKNWIFVFGTVLFNYVENNQTYYYNLSIVMLGGQQDTYKTELNAEAIIKLNVSPIDYLDYISINNVGISNNTATIIHNYVKYQPKILNIPGDSDNIVIDDDGVFILKGHVFGLEICMDHGVGVLANTNNISKQNSLENINNVKIQIIPAGGMVINDYTIVNSIKTKGGIVLLCDGYMPPGASSEFRQYVPNPNIPGTYLIKKPVIDNLIKKNLSPQFSSLFKVIQNLPRIAIYESVFV